MELNFIIGTVMGVFLGWIMRSLMQLSSRAYALEDELHEHRLDMSIRKEKVLEDGQVVVDRVTDQFTTKLSEIVSDNLVCEEDMKKDMMKYSVQIWTKFS